MMWQYGQVIIQIFFRNYNLGMIFHNMFRGTFEVTSVVTENEKAVINVSGDNLSNTSVKDRRIIFVKLEKNIKNVEFRMYQRDNFFNFLKR